MSRDPHHLVSPANTLKCHSAPELDAYDLLTPVPFETQSVSSMLALESPLCCFVVVFIKKYP